MALSNWDTLAVDLEGQPIDGSFTSPGGASVAIYKNWLYIRDEKAWHDGSFVKPTIMQIQHGELDYHDVDIVAIRGPQNGVYVACWHVSKKTVTGMVGCGVSGYYGSEWVGVQPESVKFLQEWISASEKSFHEELIQSLAKDFDEDCVKRIGKTKEEFIEETRAERHFVFREEIARVKIDKGLRFNQGDAYFAEKLGFEIPATETGKAQSTILSRMIGSDEVVEEVSHEDE